MAISNITFYDTFLDQLGKKAVNLSTDTFKAALFTSTYAPNSATDGYYASITGELSNGSGYTTGGITLSSVTFSSLIFDAANIYWDFTGTRTFKYLVLYDDTVVNDLLVGYFTLDNTGASITQNNGDRYPINFSVNGIFRIMGS